LEQVLLVIMTFLFIQLNAQLGIKFAHTIRDLLRFP